MKIFNKITTIFKVFKANFYVYKLQIVTLVILGFLNGLLEGIGVNAIIPLLSFVSDESSGGNDIITKLIKNIFLKLHIDFSVKYLLIFICLMFIIKSIVLIISNYIKIKIATNYEEQTRNHLFNKTMQAGWTYLMKQKLGHLSTVLMTNVSYGSVFLQQISISIVALTGLIIYIFVAINISLYITIITLIFGSLLFIFFQPLIKKTRYNSRQIAYTNKLTSNFINENILGIKTIKSSNTETQIIQKGKKYFNKLKKLKTKILFFKQISNSIQQPFSLIFICIIFVFYYKSPNFHFASFVVIIYLINRIFQHIQQFQSSIHFANESMPYLDDIIKYKDDATKTKEFVGNNYNKHNFHFKKSIKFKNVNFSYNKNKSTLSGINFEIKKGNLIGIIGPSGSGKTTIVDLFLRLLSVEKGEILLDDKNISSINLNEWRKNIGYVSQDIFLTNDSILENIKFHNDKISEYSVKEAAKKANIYNFIQNLPDKFLTNTGEHGVMLSAGQKQRIIIARVLARNPKILILDEATSALDNESEIKIQNIIENLKNKMTVIVIAHRLSTIINSDKLIIIENGKIKEQGAPKKLLKNKNSYFYKVYNIRNNYA